MKFFEKSNTGRPRDRATAETKAEDRKESLMLLAIALLFVANVVLYLCHHYGLTSLYQTWPHVGMAAGV